MFDFLSLEKDAFGLEITDTNIRIMKLIRHHNRLVVIAVGGGALEENIVKNGAVKDEKKLAAEIKSLVNRIIGQKTKPRYVVVSLPEKKAFLQVIKMPRLTGKEMRAAVVFQAENYIPLALEKVYLDFETIPHPLEDFYQCEVLVAAVPKEIVDSYIRVLDAAGLVCLAMELESQSVARAALAGKNLEKSAMIVHIGDIQSNVIVYARGSIRFTFTIPISNRDFITKIRDCTKTNLVEAEKLKNKCGIEEFIRPEDGEKSGLHAEKRKIFEALIPGLIDFSQQVQKCIRYYQTHENASDFDNKKFDKILICGNGADLRGLEEFLSLKLGLSVERLILPVGMDESVFKKNDLSGTGICGCAISAGLAMRALMFESFEDGENCVFLAPPKPKKRLKRKIKPKVK